MKSRKPKRVSTTIRRKRGESDLEFWIRWHENVAHCLDVAVGYERIALTTLKDDLKKAINDEAAEELVQKLRTMEGLIR